MITLPQEPAHHHHAPMHICRKNRYTFRAVPEAHASFVARIRVGVGSGFAGDHPTLIDSQVESIQSTSVTWTGHEVGGGNNDSRCNPRIDNCLTWAVAQSLFPADIKSRLQGICIMGCIPGIIKTSSHCHSQSNMPSISTQTRRDRLLVPIDESRYLLCSRRLIDYSRGMVIGIGQSSHYAISTALDLHPLRSEWHSYSYSGQQFFSCPFYRTPR